jgi:putative toxin-antitoxin system antitoxin component (TIGR02293 family)
MARSRTVSVAARNKFAEDSLGVKNTNIVDLVKSLKHGLSYVALAHFQQKSGLPFEVIGRVLQIPPRTLARRKAAGVLTSQESERLVRLANLFDKATALFEGEVTAAANWFRAPNQALGGQTPLGFAESEIGARAVEDLIGRLEYGVYS